MSAKRTTRWERYRKAGEFIPNHWTRKTIVSYCHRCDRTFPTKGKADAHAKQASHKVLRKLFYRGQRSKNLRGERNGAHKLTALEVTFMRHLFRGGVSTYVLGLFFGVTQGAAHAIASGKTWKEARP